MAESFLKSCMPDAATSMVIRFPAEALADVRARAEALGIPVAEVIRTALRRANSRGVAMCEKAPIATRDGSELVRVCQLTPELLAGRTGRQVVATVWAVMRDLPPVAERFVPPAVPYRVVDAEVLI